MSTQLRLKVHSNRNRDDVIQRLHDLGYDRVNMVIEPGTFAVKGSIVDVFAVNQNQPVRCDFFGGGISVSGLLAGRDICQTLEQRGDHYDAVLLPPNCVNGEGVTLDDMTVLQMSEQVGMPVRVGEYDIAGSINAFLKEKKGAQRGQGRQLSELGYYVGRQK